VPANIAHEAGNFMLPRGGHLQTTNLKTEATVEASDQCPVAPTTP